MRFSASRKIRLDQPLSPGREQIARWRRRVATVVGILQGVLALAAAAALVAEYGFHLSPEFHTYTHLTVQIVLWGFLAGLVAKVIVVEHRRDFLREHRLDLAFGLLVLLHLLVPDLLGRILTRFTPAITPEIITSVYLVVSQSIAVLAFLPFLARSSNRIMNTRVQPATLLAISFLFLMAAGTGLLMLPRASAGEPLSPVNALFTATSAVCVTGLTVLDIPTAFTPLGHGILLALMQIGGLGIMTLTTFLASLGGSVGALKQYSTLSILLGDENVGQIRSTALRIGLLTLCMEAAGAIVLFGVLDAVRFDSTADRIFASVFHSVSAFCNAGFALTGTNLDNPLFRTNVPALSTLMLLIVTGGIGFPVLLNTAHVLGEHLRGRPARLSLHSKIVCLMTSALIAGGAAAFFAIERDGVLASLPLGERLLTSLFQSVTCRTAGFNTVPIGDLRLPTLLMMMVLMWIGASPASTGGGIKTTTIALALLSVRAAVLGRSPAEAFSRRIPGSAMVRALSTVILSLLTAVLILFVLLLTEHHQLYQLMFEVISALGTVGLSTGITPSLSTAGKLVIVLTIFIGRIGVLGAVLALTPKREGRPGTYTEENVITM